MSEQKVTKAKTTSQQQPLLSAGDVVERLCKLSSEVYKRVDGIHPNDCFCATGGHWDIAPDHYGPTHAQGYRNDGVVLQFIERSVRAAVKAHRGKIR